MSEVEKAIESLMKARKSHDGVTMFEVERLRKAVRAEAIASTEAKFRELAEKWLSQGKHKDDPKDICDCDQCYHTRECGKELQSLLTPCPQSRHDAGESESK